MDYFAPSKYRIRANKPPPLPRSLSFFAHFLSSELKPSRVADPGGIDQEPEPTLENTPDLNPILHYSICQLLLKKNLQMRDFGH